jgi:flagellar hook-associated protein 1 FlgK
MSLSGALNIGRSALTAHQAAIQTTGNNISNAGNADYTRQVPTLSPTRDQLVQSGVFVGTGVQLDSISRQIDEALNGRLRAATGDDASAQVTQQWVGQVESVFNELTDGDLSTQLSTFFGSWSNLANKPQDVGLRQVVIQNGASVASWLQQVRGQLGSLRGTIDGRIPDVVADADGLAGQIAALNGQISTSEAGGGVANSLRDQRDAALKSLASLVDVSTVEQPNGSLNVYVGSEPLVFGTDNSGLTVVNTTDAAGDPVPEVRFKSNLGTVTVRSGQLGGLLGSRKTLLDVTADVDAIANGLINEVNKVHAAGQGLEGFASVSATNRVDDPAVALNDPAAGLKNAPTNGSFVVHVKDKATGLTTSTLVKVDLDGIGGNDTTLDGLAAALGGVTGVKAGVSAGQLTVAADNAAVELSFSQDTSGTLAALGVNSFFTGESAVDIGVNQTVKDNPNLLAAARNGASGDNGTARALAELEGKGVAALNGQSIKDRYQSVTNVLATTAASAKTNADASQGVLDTLTAQHESLSGVSLDEEAINLIREQRAFQGAARLISTVNEMMDVVLNMAR